jgi:hypothetical protein
MDKLLTFEINLQADALIFGWASRRSLRVRFVPASPPLYLLEGGIVSHSSDKSWSIWFHLAWEELGPKPSIDWNITLLHSLFFLEPCWSSDTTLIILIRSFSSSSSAFLSACQAAISVRVGKRTSQRGLEYPFFESAFVSWVRRSSSLSSSDWLDD